MKPPLTTTTAVAAVDSTVAESVGKVRPGEAKYRTAVKSEVAEYSCEFPTSFWENIAGRLVGYRTVAEMAEKSGRECKPASRVQAMQVNDDWLKEVVTGELAPC